MALGDLANVFSRIKRVLPPGWFTESGSASGTPQSKTPILDAILSGPAELGSWAYSLFSGIQTQTRLATATGGWLDIASTDLLGSSLLRLAGETDDAFRTRIKANLFLKANTRSAVQTALANLTGAAVRVVEPWQPNDTGVWDGSAFYDIDTAANPAEYADPSLRYQAFIKCVLPVATSANPAPAGDAYDTNTFFDTTTGWYWDASAPFGAGATLVYGLIQRLKVFGTKIWVQFVPPPGTGNPFTLDTSSLSGPDVLT